MLVFYNIIIYCYELLIKFHSIFNEKSRQWIKGRKNIFNKIKTEIKDHKEIIWFHCASLGEYEQAKSLILNFKKKHTRKKILLTFFSPSGYENFKQEKFIDWIFYLPSDTKENAKKFISLINPEIAFFIKSEFWINYMIALEKQKIPLYHISSIFKEDNFILNLKFFQNQLMKSKHFFVQDKSSLLVLEKFKIHQVSIVGDARIDTIISDKEKNNLQIIRSKRKILIFGSVWPEDEHIYMSFIKNKANKFNYLIAPHDLNYSNKIKDKTNGVLFSQIINNDISKDRIIIINNIGMLKNLYKYCDYVYIGGGFGKGIHNILEPAVYHLPIIFGKNYTKNKEAKELIKLNCAISVKNNMEFQEALHHLQIKFEKSKILKYFKDNHGAVKKILNKI